MSEDDDEVPAPDMAAKQLLNDSMQFGVFLVTVDESKNPQYDGLVLKVINEDALEGMAYRCDGKIRPIHREEALRTVQKHE